VTAEAEGAFGGTPLARALNIFAFFTIQSNVLVGITAGLLAVNPDRSAPWFAWLRLTSLVAITVTMVVFHVVLSRLLDLDSWAQAANQLEHTVVPVLAIAGWAAFGPRGLISARTTRLALVFPLLYVAFTMIRGPLASNFYHYPFVDVAALGYARVAGNAFWVALLFVAVAAGAGALDRHLDRAARHTT